MDQYKWKLLQKKAKLLGYEIITKTGTNKLLNEWAERHEFESYEEYLDVLAIGRGFTCYEEYVKVWKYYPGMPNPLKENRKDAQFLGLYIAENSILKLFKGAERMKRGNRGYDIICNNGYKLEVKAATLTRYNTLSFHLAKNKVTDYFILLGFNNIIELKPIHLWIIKSNEIIRDTNIGDMDILGISNEPKLLESFQKYTSINKLEKLKEICKEFNGKSEFNTNIPTKDHILDIILDLRRSGKSRVNSKDILDILILKAEHRPRILSAEECSR